MDAIVTYHKSKLPVYWLIHPLHAEFVVAAIGTVHSSICNALTGYCVSQAAVCVAKSSCLERNVPLDSASKRYINAVDVDLSNQLNLTCQTQFISSTL